MAPLTQPGLVLPDGSAQYFPNPAARAIAFAQMARNSVAPEIATTPDALYGDASEPSFVPQAAPPQPAFVQPSFQQATTDQFGNARVGPGLTKLGKLLGFLKLASQGALDAAGGGALNAPRQGQSTFGEGVNAAEVMPVLRAQRQQALERGALENQELQANIGLLPLIRAATLAHQQALTSYLERRTNASTFRTSPQGVARFGPDGSFQGIVPGTGPNPKGAENTPEARKAFADQNPNLFTSQQDLEDFVLGRKQEKFSSPNEWTIRMKAAQGDPEAIALLRQRQQEQENIAEIRHERSGGAEKPRQGTPGQFQQADRRKNEALQKLQGRYTWNHDTNEYDDSTGGDSLTPDQFQEKKQAIQDQYEQEDADLGGSPSHYEYPVQGATGTQAQEASTQPQPAAPSSRYNAKVGGAASAKAPVIGKGAIIVNHQTGERRQWNGSQWVTITPARQ